MDLWNDHPCEFLQAHLLFVKFKQCALVKTRLFLLKLADHGILGAIIEIF